MDPALITYTIYAKPLDYPQNFVVRRWTIARGSNNPVPDEEPHAVCMTLAGARQSIPPGLYRLSREKNDDACIVETWI